MTREEMTKALAYYEAINPRYAPDIRKIPVVSFWFEQFGHVPASEFKRVMDRLIKNDQFPTVRQVEQALGSAAEPNADASIVAGKIMEAIGRFGSWGPDEAKAAIGPVGWRVVELQGGWSSVCEIENRDKAVKNAQWRDLAKSLLERGEEAIQNFQIEAKSDQAGLKLVASVMDSFKKGSNQ